MSVTKNVWVVIGTDGKDGVRRNHLIAACSRRLLQIRWWNHTRIQETPLRSMTSMRSNLTRLLILKG
jgi:hypothetical protein